MVLVGAGMLAVMAITGLALWRTTSVFTRTTKGMEHSSFEVQRIWKIDQELSRMSLTVHDFIVAGEPRFRSAAEESRVRVRALLAEMTGRDLAERDRALLDSLLSDFTIMEKKTDRIFSLTDPAGKDRMPAFSLMQEVDGLLEWMGRDIENYKAENASEMAGLADTIRGLEFRTTIALLLILVSVLAFLLGFGLYLSRNISVPLAELWEGTAAISRGNLDVQMRPPGGGEIAKLAERFNDMARQLKKSYADLEHRLLERTQELSTINAVALALGRTGDLRDILHDSLLTIVESLSGIDPRGGIFLCDPDRSVLRLVTQVGLGSEFAQRESVIAMGECLCGRAAQTGQMISAGPFCQDPPHSRRPLPEEHSHIIIPIKSRGTVYGVLFLYPAAAFTLKPSDVQLFDAVGSQLGTAVENYRLFGEVKASGEKYAELFEKARDILCVLDPKGLITAVNRSAARFLGEEKSAIIGRSVLEFLSPEGAERARRAFAGEGGELGRFLEFEVVRKDGSRAFIEASPRTIVRDGVPSGFQIAARDVTEQRELREMLVKAERLAAIGQVGIAFRHEINNPLTTVIGNAELLLERYEHAPQEDLVKRLQTILDNSLRIVEIVNRLKAIKVEKTVDYIEGVKMTDLQQG